MHSFFLFHFLLLFAFTDIVIVLSICLCFVILVGFVCRFRFVCFVGFGVTTMGSILASPLPYKRCVFIALVELESCFLAFAYLFGYFYLHIFYKPE